MIFKEFCPSQKQNRITYNPGYSSIINDTLELIDASDQSKHKLIRATYPYLSLK